jgi:hypothetical protein
VTGEPWTGGVETYPSNAMIRADAKELHSQT